ncbi:hypothetical protein ACU4GI_33210 [Cupriavidus basilensis]
MAALLCLAAAAANAQTIEEITTLQRKKLVSELTKAIETMTPATARVLPAPVVKPQPTRPILAGISGDPGDTRRLTISVIEGERAAADYRVGEMTADGWQVTRIGRRDATFTRRDNGRPVSLTVEYTGAPVRSSVAAPSYQPTQMAVPVATGAVPTPAAAR